MKRQPLSDHDGGEGPWLRLIVPDDDESVRPLKSAVRRQALRGWGPARDPGLRLVTDHLGPLTDESSPA